MSVGWMRRVEEDVCHGLLDHDLTRYIFGRGRGLTLCDVLYSKAVVESSIGGGGLEGGQSDRMYTVADSPLHLCKGSGA